MKNLLFLLLSIASIDSFAEVYQCKAADGHAIFQKAPCTGQEDAKPMVIKQPSPALLQKMRIEEKDRDIRYLEMKLKERELHLRRQQANNDAARIRAYNRAITNSIVSRAEAQARSDAWNEYMNCRDRYGYGNNDSRSHWTPNCERPTD